MPSLYAQYLMERTADHILEVPEGFATYRYIEEDKSVYIVDIFVVPKERRSGAASRLADEIIKMAKVRGCVIAYGSVVPSMKNSTVSAKVLFGYGMSIHRSENDFIVFKKEI